MGEKNTQNIYSVDTCSCKSKQEIKHSENNESKSYRPPLRSLIHTNLNLKSLFVFLLNGLAYFFCFSIPVTKHPDKSNLESGVCRPTVQGWSPSWRELRETGAGSGWSHHIHSQGEGCQHWCSARFLHFIQSGPHPGRGPIHSGSFSYTLTQSYVLRG